MLSGLFLAGAAFQLIFGLVLCGGAAWAYYAKLRGKADKDTKWLIITLILALTGLIFLAGALMSFWVYFSSSAIQSHAQGLLAK